MDKHLFYFRDDKLTAEKALNSTLRLIVGADVIGLMALGAGQELLAMEQIQVSNKKMPEGPELGAGFQEFLQQHPLMSMPFKSVQLAVFSPFVVLTPRRLFSEADYTSQFRLLYSLEAGAVFGHQELPEHGCCLVWAAPPAFEIFSSRFQHAHLATSLIREFHAVSALEDHSIFLHIRGRQAQITVFEQRNLVFYNNFEFVKPTDLLYFVLLAFDQFKQQPEHTQLWVAGQLLEDSEHFQMLQRYVRHIHWVAPRRAVSLPPAVAAMPAHYWFDLMSL